MWKSETQTAERRQPAARSAGLKRRPLSCFMLSAVCLLLVAGCRTDMQDQPKMKPYRSSSFFKDGLSSRPQVEGTVARGMLMEDKEFYTGKKAGRAGQSLTASGPQPALSGSVTGPAAYPDDVEVFPLAVNEELVRRGKERYEIFCSACHGLTGHGDGMIVRRGFRRAVSFNDDRLRQAPVGHFFDAITNGWGAMPSYASQIPVKDRWAIIAYVRALQLAQQGQTAPESAPPSPTPAPPTGGHQ